MEKDSATEGRMHAHPTNERGVTAVWNHVGDSINKPHACRAASAESEL
jgi:hypothetical protein